MSSPTIYVAGHKGLVGSALHRMAVRLGYDNVVVRDRAELDLLNAEAVDDFFAEIKPKWAFLAAAKVGGIYANNTYPADFMLENLIIQNSVISAAHRHGVAKLLFLGSSCIYPKNSPQPIKEDYLLSSYLETTNEAYALAKIAGVKLCGAFNRQYGTNYMSVMPSNLYGLNDNYHPKDGHALPMLLRRFHEAKVANQKAVTVWGTGKPRREFLFADDLAEACFFLMEKFEAADVGELINVGPGKDIEIRDLASLIAEVVGFNGEILFDASKPDGTMSKCLDVSKISELGWVYKTELKEGLKITYQDFLVNPSIRR